LSQLEYGFCTATQARCYPDPVVLRLTMNTNG
jgi:hypothetical protein